MTQSNNNDNIEQQVSVMTRRGAKMVDKLADLTVDQRAARLKEWKKNRSRRRIENVDVAMGDGVVVDEDGQVFIEERDVVADSIAVNERNKEAKKEQEKKGPKRDVIKLSSQILRNLLKDEKWSRVCGKVKQYQEELASITKELQDQGKPCTGCALKPYFAEFIKKLQEDFRDEEVITAEEVASIKKGLQTGSLQVGIRNGKVHVR